jgi:outer membrane protein OmpA-like peptidoglycan-associated protein
MATHISTLERLSASAAVLKLTPLLLAALLVSCSTKSQRIGSLSGDPSMVTAANSKARATPGPEATIQPSAASGAASSRDGESSGQGDAQTGSLAGDAGSNAADASSSSDEARGVGASGREGAQGDKASSQTGGTTGVAGRDATDNQSKSASTRSARPGAAGSGKPGASSANDASSHTAASAAEASASDAGGADLSSGDALAGLESDAAAGPTGHKGGVSAKRKSGPAQGATAGQAGNISGTDSDSSGTGGAATAGVEADARIAAIDVPSGNVKVDEEYRPQTLGGVLPLVLGVNEEGRFDFDQYSLRPEVKRILDELADKLKTAEYDRLDIIGYTDRIGSSDYNRRLSELRAYAVAQYLMGRGVPENKIHYEGRGEKDPLTPSGECQGLAREDLITCLQKDRRVKIEASIHRKHATVVQ